MLHETRSLRHLFVCTALIGGLFACKKNQETTSTDQLHQSENAEKTVFTYPRTSDPKTLDPHAQLDSVSGMFVTSIYDRLLTYHYLKRPYELQPSLLEKMPSVSEDGLTYSFTLRKGVFFHNDKCFLEGKGREMTAADVIYSIKRFADINVNTRSWFFLQGSITGLDAFREETKKLAGKKIDYTSMSVAGLKETSPYTFDIVLTNKNPLLLYAFAGSSMGIVPKEAVDTYGEDLAYHPVGSGPYMLREYIKKQTMIFDKNPNYFDVYPSEGAGEEDKNLGLLTDAGKKLPFIDEIHIPFIPEAQPAMLQFLNGEISWIGLDRDNFIKMATRTPQGSFELNSEYKNQFDIYSEPALTVSYIPFNMKDSIVGKNKLLRQALAYALNVQEQIDLLSNGRGIKIYSIVPLAITGSEKDIGQFGYEFNLNKAKELLAKAGYPEGKGLAPIEMTISDTSSTAKKSFEFIRNAFAQINVTLVPDYKTWSTYLQAIESGDFQMASSAWAADYPDAENFYQLFYGANTAPGPNSAAFQNKEYDALYDQIRFLENGPERAEKLTRMAKILQDEVPCIFESNPIMVGLTQKNISNFKRNMMVDTPFAYISVSKKKAQVL